MLLENEGLRAAWVLTVTRQSCKAIRPLGFYTGQGKALFCFALITTYTLRVCGWLV